MPGRVDLEELVQALQIIDQAAAVQADIQLAPEVFLERVRLVLDGPVLGPPEPGTFPYPLQEYPQPPVGNRVTEEQVVRFPQFHEDLPRHDLLGRTVHVVDVVILGNYIVIFTIQVKETIHCAIDPHDHRAPQPAVASHDREVRVYVWFFY